MYSFGARASVHVTTFTNATTAKPRSCPYATKRCTKRITAQVRVRICKVDYVWRLRAKCDEHRKGVADEQLALLEGEREHERGRKRSRSSDYDMTGSRKRSRSISSYSSASVSTISTNLSRRSRDLPSSDHDNYYTSQLNEYTISSHQSQKPPNGLKRRRSITDSSSSRSVTSDGSRSSSEHRSGARERMTRRRWKSKSPEQRGRRRSRSSARDDRESRRSRSRSRSRGLRRRHKMLSPLPERSRSVRKQRVSPPSANDNRKPHASRGYGNVMDEHKHRDGVREMSDRHEQPSSNNRRWRESPDRYRRRHNDENRSNAINSKDRPNRIRHERSLSPYSKRIALTQAMNRGVA